MNIAELLEQLDRKKVALSIRNDRLLVRGEEQLIDDPSLVSLLRENKHALIELIQAGRYAAPKESSVQVPPNLIPSECTALTPEMLPLIALSAKQIDRIVSQVPGGVGNVQDIYPLAPLQEGILFHHLMAQQGDPYLVTILLSFDNRRRLDAYLEAMQAVVDRHDILRTAIFWEGLPEPVQVVLRKAILPVEEVLLDADAGDTVEQLRARFNPRRSRIDLHQAPLLRLFTAYDRRRRRWVLMMLQHHLSGDHATLDVLQDEIQTHLFGKQEQLPASLPFRNLVAQARLGIRREEHEAFFRKMLGDVDEPTAPFGLLEVQGDGTDIVEAHVWLDDTLSGRMRENARRLGVSVASLCHLAWAQVLARIAGREDVVFGTVLFGRIQGGEGADRVLGPFINTLPLRIQIGDQSVLDSARHTHTLLAELLGHEHASLALAQRCSAVQAPAPLFSSLLNYRHSEGAPVPTSAKTGQTSLEMEWIGAEERSNYPVTLSVDDLGDRFRLAAQVDASVDPVRVCAFMQTALTSLVTALEQAPDTRLRSLQVLPAEERQQVLFDWNDTAAEFPDQYVHQLFQAQVERTPQATALVFQDRELSYAELNRQANRLAHYLSELGVKPDDRIAICVERGFEMMVGLLAILKAGGAYVPLDPAYPSQRLRFVLDDSAPVVLLTQSHLRALLPISFRFPVLLLDDPSPAWDAYPETNPDPAAVPLTPDHLAYVIYTSGSTGAPKGVMVQHRALQNFFFAMDRILREDTSPSQWVSTTSISFDISVLELFWPLARGHQVLLHPGLTALTSRRKRRTQPHQFSLFFFAAADETRQQEKYRLLLESGRIADERGFCAVWTPERHFHSFGGLYPNPSITGAAIAAITKRTEIRAGSVVLPLHDPLRVAEEWAVVDNLSNGRVALSFASGWNANDFVLKPEQFDQRRQIMMREIETVRSLWRGEAVTRRNGAGKDVSVHIYPRPVQNELKIWLTAAQNPETFRAAGEMGAYLLTHLLGQDIQELSEKIAIYRSAYRQAGHQGNGHVALMLHTFIGSDAGSAHDIVHDPFCNYLEQSVDLLRALSQSLDLDLDPKRLTQDDLRTLAQHAFDRYYFTSALIGDEDACLRMLERLGDADVDEIACLVDFGVELETTLEGLSRLADLKDRWLGGIETRNIQTDWHGRSIQCTPSFASALLEHWSHEQVQPSLKRILVGGEACSGALYDSLREFATDGVLNMYGPTETTIWSSVYSSKGEKESGTIPIGRPIANTRIYILDGQGDPAPVGVAGEIYIGGAGVARGYLNRPELTSERFLKDPFVSDPGARTYKTGDLGRWLPDGNVEFLGRNDFQVKIRGFRIELGEIEARLVAHAAIREAVVLAREDQPGDKRLVAYYVPHAEVQDELHAGVLRVHLSASLPEYMVPAAYVRLHSLPLTPNGKLDRKALPAPDTDAYAVQNYEEPQGETEILLARIWAEVLKLDRIGRRDNFFELGGHSLLAVQLMGRIQQALYREVRLADIFAHPTLEKLAKILPSAEQAKLPAITPAERRDKLPLSFAQQRLWFLAQLEGGSEAYHIPLGLELIGDLDRSALRQALDRILVRHEALRTTFITVDGMPLQRIGTAESSHFHLLEYDLRQRQDLQSEFERLSSEEANQPFDLEQSPLIRGRLLRLDEDRHVLLITMHHIISDGWSMGIWVDEFSALYSAFREQRPDPLPAIPLQYADYAVWQRQWIEGEVVQQQAEFWKNNLAGAPPLLELPADHPRPAQLSYAGSYVAFEIDSQLTAALRDLSLRHNTTLYMTLLAGWATLLSRLSGQQDLVIGTPTANRGRGEIEGLIGFFVNTLALRLDLSHAPSVSDLLARVKAQTLAAQQHQDIPFEQVVELARPARSLAHSPLFQAALAWQNAPDSSPVLPGLAVHRVETSSYQMAELDLTLSVHEAGETLAGAIKYSTALFNRSTIERYLGYLRNLLRAMVNDPTTSLDRLPMLPADERQHVLYGWNDTVMDYPRERCVHQLFEAQVERTPEATALIFEDRHLSYGELNRRANRLAHYLRELGVKPDDRVALCLERGLEMMVGLLGVLKAGAAYVPLDPAYPAERLRFMLDDSAPVALLTQTHLRSLLPDGFSFPVLLLEKQSTAWNGYSDINPDPAAVALTADHLAYVIYTSGSTGKPKGVMVGHRNVVNFLGSMSVEPGMTHLDSILAVTSLSFDIAGLELFLPLLNGAVSVLVGRADAADPARLQQALSRYRVTMMQATPATWRLLLDSGWSGSLDFKVLCGGEALPADLSARLRERVGTLWNMYGPTETTIWSTCRQVDGISVPTSAYESIGHPIANTQVYLLDGNFQPVPPGVSGDLYIGGDGVARGYLNRPELTAERFVGDPFSDKPGARMYKTGDLGRWLPDGNIEFLGRDDDQVKIRGFRIELGEIEARLEEHPGIREAVALTREDQAGDKRLVAYYVPVAADQDELGVEALRAHLSKALPEYMVPAVYVRLEALPLTPNGKLDRKAMPAPDGEAFAVRGYEPPKGNRETTLAAIWAELLKLDRVGRHDNFFELGGHSLLAVQLIERMRRNGARADVRTLFATPTVAELAAAVAGAEPQVQVPPNLIPALKREKTLSPDEVELSI